MSKKARDADRDDSGSNELGALMTETEAAEYLRLTPRALQSWRTQGRGPRFVRISARAVRYRVVDLKNWVEGRLRSSTSDPGPSEARA